MLFLYSLENIYSHLEKKQSTARLMFFSSAFNTIQPYMFTCSKTFKHEITIICYFMDL